MNTVYANPAQGISGTDPSVAGGDGYNLADVGLTRSLVRITDSGREALLRRAGRRFDLDALAVVNAEKVTP